MNVALFIVVPLVLVAVAIVVLYLLVVHGRE
jgi:hypothetical protein